MTNTSQTETQYSMWLVQQQYLYTQCANISKYLCRNSDIMDRNRPQVGKSCPSHMHWGHRKQEKEQWLDSHPTTRWSWHLAETTQYIHDHCQASAWLSQEWIEVLYRNFGLG